MQKETRDDTRIGYVMPGGTVAVDTPHDGRDVPACGRGAKGFQPQTPIGASTGQETVVEQAL